MKVDIKKTLIEHHEQTGANIYTVDGASVRFLHDQEFLLGGNWLAHTFIPKGEIWVERFLTGPDMRAVIIHECYEAELMMDTRRKGMTYEKAHKKALEVEQAYRDYCVEHIGDAQPQDVGAPKGASSSED